MSYEDGMAALQLQMPERIPRTEYSAERHWELVSQVSGIAVCAESDQHRQLQAQQLFTSPECWNYDFFWHNIIDEHILGEVCTDMGHAVFEADGSDFHVGGHAYFTSSDQVLQFQPSEVLPVQSAGTLVKFFEEDYRSQVRQHPTGIAMTGTYITLISGCIALYGWDLFLTAIGEDPHGAGMMLARYARWMSQYTEALALSDIPVVLIHDDMVWSAGPFTHPQWYRTYVFPLLKALIAPLREAGKKVLFACDGDFTMFIDDIAACGVNGFIFEPFTDLELLAQRYGKTHVLIGNVDTRILLSGTGMILPGR